MKIFILAVLIKQFIFKEELIMVIDIIRHGVRDYNLKQNSLADVGFTKIGYDNSIKIGQKYKEEIDLFKSLKPEEVLVKTSNRIRTVLTALGIHEGLLKEDHER